MKQRAGAMQILALVLAIGILWGVWGIIHAFNKGVENGRACATLAANRTAIINLAQMQGFAHWDHQKLSVAAIEQQQRTLNC